MYYNSMWQAFQNTKIPALVNKFLIYFLIVYVFFILGRAVWFNWQLKNMIRETKASIENLEKQNRDFENLILYYQSDSFREVEARQKLGLKKPGETVVAIPTKDYSNYQEETQAEKERVAGNIEENSTPNWKIWWKYFFE